MYGGPCVSQSLNTYHGMLYEPLVESKRRQLAGCYCLVAGFCIY